MKITENVWTTKNALGKRIKHVAYGYTMMVNGKRERKWCKEWTSKEDVITAVHERQQQMQAGQVERPANVTLAQAVDRYMQFKADRGKRSLKNDRFTFIKQLLPYLGLSLPLRQLTSEKIADFEEKRIKEVSVYTVRNELACLRHLLRLAHKKWGYLDRVPDIEMPKAPKGRTRFLSEEEIARLLTACGQSKNRALHAIVVLAINTGMRKGELLNLTWERVDLTRDLGFGATVTLYDTKSGEPRGVPLNQVAVSTLAAIEPDMTKRLGRVFKRSTGEDQISVRTAWERALKRADISNFRFHDLRHTCGSYLTMRGRPMREIQEVLGHKSLSMTLRYSHLSPKHLRSCVESLDGLTPTISLDDDSRKMTHKMTHNGLADDIPVTPRT
jgi:integrase